MTPPPFANCEACTAYAHRRMKVIFPAIKRVARKRAPGERQISPSYLAALYFSGIHERHLSGKAL